MPFNYEQSIWGKGTASLHWSDPTAFRLKQSLEAVVSLPAGSRVLELGSGAGQFIRAVKKNRLDLDCFGSDISSEALKLAVEANDGVHYALSAENTLPYGDNYFDAILIFDVLEHVANPGDILDEAHRVLKPGGIFYVFVPCEGDWTSFWHFLDLLGLKKDLTRKYAGHINYFTRKELLTHVTDLTPRPSPRGEGNPTRSFERVNIRYSEHILGQLLGIIAFHLMDRAAKKQGTTQINNEAYFEKQSGGVVNLIKKAVNALVYLESTVLQCIPSPNVHIIVQKLKD